MTLHLIVFLKLLNNFLHITMATCVAASFVNIFIFRLANYNFSKFLKSASTQIDKTKKIIRYLLMLICKILFLASNKLLKDFGQCSCYLSSFVRRFCLARRNSVLLFFELIFSVKSFLCKIFQCISFNLNIHMLTSQRRNLCWWHWHNYYRWKLYNFYRRISVAFRQTLCYNFLMKTSKSCE